MEFCNNKSKGGAFVPFKEHVDKKISGLSLMTPSSELPSCILKNNGGCRIGSGSSLYAQQNQIKFQTKSHNRHEDQQHQQQNSRKQRRCWSPELHRRFVEALQELVSLEAHKVRSFQQQTTPRQPPSQPEEAIEETQELKEVEGEGTQGEELGFEEIHIFKTEVARTKSDVEPASGVVPTKFSKKMRKSSSLQSPFSHFEEEDIVETRRPAIVRERKGSNPPSYRFESMFESPSCSSPF